MKNCENCGKEITKENKTCPHCGHNIQANNENKEQLDAKRIRSNKECKTSLTIALAPVMYMLVIAVGEMFITLSISSIGIDLVSFFFFEIPALIIAIMLAENAKKIDPTNKLPKILIAIYIFFVVIGILYFILFLKSIRGHFY